jgi:hypothetical protein
MEIHEIDPEEAMFLNLKQEGISGKLQGFLQIRQKHEYPPYQPPSKPIQKPPQIDSVVIHPKKQSIAHLPPQLPKEPPVLEPDLEDMIREGPPYIREPEPVHAVAGNVASPQIVRPVTKNALSLAMPAPSPVPEPLAIADLSTEEIYGTGRGVNLPKFKLPSFRKQRSPVVDIPVRHEGRNLTGYVRPVLQVLGGIILIWFGLTSTGSYYQSLTRFTGILAKVFYEYQLGTVIAMAGVLLIYHTLAKRSGKV